MVRVATVPDDPIPPFSEMVPLVPLVHLTVKAAVVVSAVSRKVAVPKLRSFGD